VIFFFFQAEDGIRDIGVTGVQTCMPDEYKCDDSVTAYRNYYMGDKAYFAKWSKRDKPKWWNV